MLIINTATCGHSQNMNLLEGIRSSNKTGQGHGHKHTTHFSKSLLQSDKIDLSSLYLYYQIGFFIASVRANSFKLL